MDRISKIANIININLTSTLGLGGYIYGICEKNTVDSKTFFIEKKANKVQKGIFLEDSAPLTIIHYSDNIQTETDFESGFGGSPLVLETHSNVVLVYLPNKNNELESKKILQSLGVQFPTTICKTDKSLLKVRGVNISLGASSYNKHSIFTDEFTGQSDNIQDNNILLKINYEVLIKIDKSCHNIGCDDEEVCEINTWGGNAEL